MREPYEHVRVGYIDIVRVRSKKVEHYIVG
jgi:hypothetical protein